MHEIFIPFNTIATLKLDEALDSICDKMNIKPGRRKSGCGLLETYRGYMKDGRPFYDMAPTDALCDWLTQCTPSLAYIETCRASVTNIHIKEGMIFGFNDAKDAVLMKLSFL